MTLDKNIIGREILSAIEAAKADYKTLAPIELWVDASTGNDANDGSEDAPLASIVEAERRLPIVIDHDILIHVAPHTGDGYAPPTFRERVMRASIDIIADSGGTHDDGFTELYTGTAQGGSSQTAVISSAGLGVDTYRGKTIEMTSGVAVNFRRTISTHTDTSIEPAIVWQTGSIAPGDTFRILEPIVQLDLSLLTDDWTPTSGVSPKEMFGFDGNDRSNPSVNFINFRVVSSALTNIQIGSILRFFGCDATIGIAFAGGSFTTGIDRVIFNNTDNDEKEAVEAGTRAAGVSPHAWVGWGFSSTHLVAPNGCSAFLFGIVAPSLVIYGPGSVSIPGGNIFTSGITVTGNAVNGYVDVELYGKYYLPDLRLRVTSAAGNAITIKGQGALVYVGTITATAALTALLVARGAQVEIATEVTLIGVTGLVAKDGSRVICTNTVPTITASGNAIEVGTLTPTVGTTAGLASTGSHFVHTDGSCVMRVA